MPRDPHKRARLDAVRQILRTQDVASQEELVRLLEERGFRVTQSSVSRDLRALRAGKVVGHYRLADGAPVGEPLELREAVLDAVRSVDPAGPNLLVVHTVVGGASRVALGIDEAGWPEVVGTVAGDDTLFIATPGARETRHLRGRLAELLNLAENPS